MEKIIELLKADKGITELLTKGKIYLVGGIVRDSFLGKESKDIDLLVTNLPLAEIASLLTPFGKVDEVGASFGVVKYTPENWIFDEPIDIAIPRTEKLKAGGNGHKDFEVVSDPFLPIELDLLRRDISINSIAIDFDGNIIDKFGGLDDIKNGIIRMTNPNAFIDDALRLIRCIGFSSRFNFKIEENTWQAIIDNKSRIRSISGERILEELDKIYKKGNIRLGIQLFIESGLSNSVFQHKTEFKDGVEDLVEDIKTREDFFSVICSSNFEKFKTVLKGDTDTAKGIKAIANVFENFKELGMNQRSEPHHRLVAFEAFKIHPSVANSGLIPGVIKRAFQSLDGTTFPREIKDLAIKGDDLIELGYKGEKIGKMMRICLNTIMHEEAPNDRDVLIEIIRREKIKI